MKLRPRSLGGQLAMLMLGGFVLGNLFGVVGLWSTSGALHPIARTHALSRVVTAYRLALMEPVKDTRWLESFNNDVANLRIDHQGSQLSMDRSELQLAQAIKQRIPAPQVTAQMPCRDNDAIHAPLARLATGPHEDLECVEIDVALGDGRWLHARQVLPTQSLWLESWRMLWSSLMIGILPVLVLMYIFVNRVLRPTTTLTNAVERMSRGERLEPLQIKGPNEIREIAVAFNQMHERITRFVDERTYMLASISHDLRTPLTALELQAVMLPESEQRTEMLHTLEEVRLMVSETLRFATQDASAETSEQVNLAELLQQLCNRFIAQGHEITVIVPVQLMYSCRPLALRRALNNVIGNAIKHAKHVQVLLLNRHRDGVLIQISDDGPGIPEAMLRRVFEPFFQLDQSRHREAASSVGLGLAIARDCIQAHGGNISLHNREHGGLVANIELPAVRNAVGLHH